MRALNDQAAISPWLTLPPPQLHLMQGEGKSVHKFMKKIDAQLAADWLHAIGVRPSPRSHGAFDGNDVRRMFERSSVRKLADLIENREFESAGT